LRLPVRWVWMAGIVATMTLSFAGLVRMSASAPEARPVQVQAQTTDAFAPDTEKAVGAKELLATVAKHIGRAAAAAADRVYEAAAKYAGATRAFAAAWLTLTVALLCVLAATLLRLRRARLHWRTHRIGDEPVLVSRNAGPALVGLLRPAIVVPAWLLTESSDRQELVVQHESEHRRAGDHVLLAGACVSVCLLPWNVALWWLLIRLRLAVELDCDARVLGRGARARSYGLLLLEIAARTRSFPFGAPALTDSRTHLERRLIAMTDTNRTPRTARASAAGFSALLLGLAACTADLPTAASIDEMDVAEARVQAEQAGLLIPKTVEGTPLYVVDGVIVGEENANRIAPDEIESIEVVKGAAGAYAYGERAANGVVRILTRSGDAGAATYGEVKPLGVPLTLTVEGSATMRRGEGGTSVLVRTARGVGAMETKVEALEKGTAVMEVEAGKFTFEDWNEQLKRPLIIVDGVIVDESFSLNRLAPDVIESIEVIKGAAALQLYEDPRAANGVIHITTRTGGR
ncbi:MAG TPA: M56 family metallopeptidase, partial [Longimicrobiales bacterium]|nr:M56 family metallopeptidase [Longimicrobiales bacterium]